MKSPRIENYEYIYLRMEFIYTHIYICKCTNRRKQGIQRSILFL